MDASELTKLEAFFTLGTILRGGVGRGRLEGARETRLGRGALNEGTGVGR